MQMFWVLNHEVCTFFSRGPLPRGFKIDVESACVPYLSPHEIVSINSLLFPCHFFLVPHEQKGADLGPCSHGETLPPRPRPSPQVFKRTKTSKTYMQDY